MQVVLSSNLSTSILFVSSKAEVVVRNHSSVNLLLFASVGIVILPHVATVSCKYHIEALQFLPDWCHAAL